MKSRKPQATSRKLLGGLQLRDEAGDHLIKFLDSVDETTYVIDVVQFARDDKQGLKLLDRTQTNVKKARELGIGTAAMSFSDISRNRNSSSLNLGYEAESFLDWESLGEPVKINAKDLTFLPDLEVTEACSSHFGSDRCYYELGACGLRLAAGGYRG